MTKKVLDNKCPTCAAPIFFNPTLGKWKCNYCDNEFTLEEMQKYNNASNQKYNEKQLIFLNHSLYTYHQLILLLSNRKNLHSIILL